MRSSPKYRVMFQVYCNVCTDMLAVMATSNPSISLLRQRPTPHRTATHRRCFCIHLQMQQGPSKLTGGGINISGEAPFEIRGFSLANAAAFVGLGITAASFFEYFSTGGAGGLSGIGFVYGIPILLVGLALKVRVCGRAAVFLFCFCVCWSVLGSCYVFFPCGFPEGVVWPHVFDFVTRNVLYVKLSTKYLYSSIL